MLEEHTSAQDGEGHDVRGVVLVVELDQLVPHVVPQLLAARLQGELVT